MYKVMTDTYTSNRSNVVERGLFKLNLAIGLGIERNLIERCSTMYFFAACLGLGYRWSGAISTRVDDLLSQRSRHHHRL